MASAPDGAHLAESGMKINPACVSVPRWPTSPRQQEDV